MPLKKLALKPGVNRENTRYTNENSWYESDKVRFRQGTPEKIGGWVRISNSIFLGICRSLWNWVTLSGASLLGVGTHLKFYIENSGQYNDITPIRTTNTLTNPFTWLSSTTFRVADAAGGYIANDFVTFNGATATGGITLNGEYQIASVTTSTYVLSTTQNVTMDTDYQTFRSGSSIANGVVLTLAAVGVVSVLPGGFTAGTNYYVVNTSGNTFKLSLTSGGAAITATTLPGGIITATPQFTGSFTSAGGTVTAAYQINTGYEIQVPLTGWGGGGWGLGAWGTGSSSTSSLRIWSQTNFGSDLIYAHRGGAIYYWNSAIGVQPSAVTMTIASPCVVTGTITLSNNTAIVLQTTGALPTGLSAGTVYYVKNSSGTTYNLSATPGGTEITTTGTQSGNHSVSSRGIPLTSLSGASGVPTIQDFIFVSDTSRFVFAFGANDYGSSLQSKMLIRWSNQESLTEWTPAATNQAGSILLSHGSRIVTCVQTRQEIVVITDSSLYGLQYVGPPAVWQVQLLGDNISIVGPNAAAVASGAVYWMGIDKFYKYDGRVQTLRCDLRQFIYGDINLSQSEQFFASTNEGFNEVWFFYCSANSTTIDRYVVYNYSENNNEGVWYYGNMARSAWLDSGLRDYPIAATYINNIVDHEFGVDDVSGASPVAIPAIISSAEFDIEDGDRFGFVWRILPDITFRGSSAANPQATLTLIPMQNSGSGYNVPPSVAGSDNAVIARTATVPIEQFTGQVYVRVRGRQMIIQMESDQLGCTWQMGSPRIDIRLDGRRGNT
jgi:hypothetical protein